MTSHKYPNFAQLLLPALLERYFFQYSLIESKLLCFVIATFQRKFKKASWLACLVVSNILLLSLKPWLDLANAYGSVSHNLIQFALNWLHIPKLIQNIIFDYYEKICAFVKTKKWTTGFFPFDIGLFQGCVLSTIIFDCVFQLLLDIVVPKTNLDTISSQLLQYPLLLKPMPMT